MSLQKFFKTDKDKETSGAWVNICKNEDGTLCRMRLARMNQRNKEYAKRVAAAQKKQRGKTIRKGETTDTDEEELKTAMRVFIGAILLDWENVQDYRAVGSVQYMPFNEANAVFLLTDLPDLADLLAQEASNLDNFLAANDEEAIKNSFPSTSTSSQ